MRVRNVSEGERTLALHALGFESFVWRGVCQRDELKRMRRHQALGGYRPHRGAEHFEEAAAIEAAQAAQDLIALLHIFRFNALMPHSHRTNLVSGPSNSTCCSTGAQLPPM